jgi:serine phosphatase RsbU (regulator of sigma subunit)
VSDSSAHLTNFESYFQYFQQRNHFMNKSDTERMQCMEVWGGNRATNRTFETPGLKIWIYSRPYRQATGGGDVYYLSSCASGRITRILLADVSGHGEKVSHVATELRDLMRRNVNYIKQTRFVRAMNRQFARFSDQGGFATAVVSTYFAPTMMFTLSNAGHPTPLLLRKDATAWSELKLQATESKRGTDLPLGILDDATYGQVQIRLQPGDAVLCYSDAVTESIDSDGRQLGQAGVLNLVRSLEAEAPEDVIPELAVRLKRLSADNLEQDDVTLMICQATGSGPTLKDNLLAPFRLFGPVADHTVLD